MTELKTKRLPEWYTRLLTVKIVNKAHLQKLIKDELIKDSFFYYILNQLLKNNGFDRSIDKYISSLNSGEFIKRLSHLVYSKLKYNSYERAYNEKEIDQVFNFAKSLSSLSYEGSYRLHLMALYFCTDQEDLLSEFVEVYENFLFKAHKNEFPDLILIILFSMKSEFDKSKILEFTKNQDFGEVITRVGPSCHEHINKNILKYCYSINEKKIFIEKEV
ncbi:hypothetical protein N9O57_00710 [bacterium]|nr:hypothetical protein [bacterium]